MSDNQNPWRDIYSLAAWGQILSATNSDSKDFIALTGEIEKYHGIHKDNFENLDARMKQLEIIASCVNDHVSRAGLELSKDQKKYDDRARKLLDKLGPWLVSLAKRCGKKREYIKTLQQFYTSHRECNHAKGAAEWIEYLNKIQEKRSRDTESIRLVPQNRMEKIDPYHRGAELHITEHGFSPTGNPMSAALCDWLNSSSSTPFLLWLETQPICLCTPGVDPDWSPAFRQVKKTLYGLSTNMVYMINFDHNPGVVFGMQADGRPGQQPFDTKTAGVAKGDSQLAYCFAFCWAQNNGVYSAIHQAGKIHHSSFTSGAKVKAAGMWRVLDGKVQFIDDNTGHYRTDGYRMYSFVEFLSQKNVFSGDAVVLVRSLENSLPVKKFLERYRDMQMRKELLAQPGPKIGLGPKPAQDAPNKEPAFAFGKLRFQQSSGSSSSSSSSSSG